MGIWSKIGTGLKVAGSVAAVVNPVFALLPALIQGVETAIKQPGAGGLKKETVRTILISYFALHEGIAERDLYDNERFMEGVDEIIDGLVKVYNAVQWKAGEAK